jgi:DNA invertase Pin-like site-specific DNA recombinase
VLELARRGEVRAVVIWRLDRIGRKVIQILTDVAELDRVGCALVSVGDGWLDTGGPARVVMLAMFGSFAEAERELMRERTRSGLERARAKGVRLGRVSSFTPAAIAEAMDLRVRRAYSWAMIAAHLRAAGYGMHDRTAIALAVRRAMRAVTRRPRAEATKTGEIAGPQEVPEAL